MVTETKKEFCVGSQGQGLTAKAEEDFGNAVSIFTRPVVTQLYTFFQNLLH